MRFIRSNPLFIAHRIRPYMPSGLAVSCLDVFFLDNIHHIISWIFALFLDVWTKKIRIFFEDGIQESNILRHIFFILFMSSTRDIISSNFEESRHPKSVISLVREGSTVLDICNWVALVFKGETTIYSWGFVPLGYDPWGWEFLAWGEIGAHGSPFLRDHPLE